MTGMDRCGSTIPRKSKPQVAAFSASMRRTSMFLGCDPSRRVSAVGTGFLQVVTAKRSRVPENVSKNRGLCCKKKDGEKEILLILC
jgi:hypothetical protein